jgi:branched-chain amino acid transport system permease protein
MVMFAPGGIASLVMMNVRVAAYRKLGRVWGAVQSEIEAANAAREGR